MKEAAIDSDRLWKAA